MRQLGGAFEAAVKATVLPAVDRFVEPGQKGGAKALVRRARARLKGISKRLSGPIAAVAKATVEHTGKEADRLGIKPRKARRQTRTDAADGDPRPFGRGRPRGIKIRDEEPKFGPLIDRWRVENVDKIESLVGHELDIIEGLLRDGEGRRVESLRADIEERFEVTKSKADLLARDQVLKLNAQITQERQVAAGVEEYVWTTSNDERVRPMHDELEGKRFRWDDPPVTNAAGDRNHPGMDYGCRCTPFAVLSELDEELFDVAAE